MIQLRHNALGMLLPLILNIVVTVPAKDETYVDEVEFVGNETFERKELLRVMELKPKGLFRKAEFTQRALRLDSSSLETFYVDRGFIDAAVAIAVNRRPDENER
ncbi:MAG: hypothetical protein GF344_14600, partial [Chitinivibrionales bacterium]|nr:hypothetical protein [Chitinivibrionales bacterium]MBD3357950.1 hypothetical protein [Chitinivibrionales bacterium]